MSGDYPLINPIFDLSDSDIDKLEASADKAYTVTVRCNSCGFSIVDAAEMVRNFFHEGFSVCRVCEFTRPVSPVDRIAALQANLLFGMSNDLYQILNILRTK